MAKKKILTFDIGKISNKSFFRQQGLFGACVERNDSIKQKLGNNHIAWKAQYAVVDSSNNLLRGSTTTTLIVDKSKELVDIYNSFNDIAKANMKNLDKSAAAAAARIVNVFNNRGIISRMSINDQMATVSTAIQDFKGDFAADVESIGAKKWVEQLETVNNEYIELYDTRLGEDKKKMNINMRAARDKLTELYRDSCTIINSLVIMEGEAQYGDFIDEINNINKKFGVKKSSGSSDETEGEVFDDNETEDEEEEEIPQTPSEYPDARVWVSGIKVAETKVGDIYFVLVDGKKVYYKLLTQTYIAYSPIDPKSAGNWEKL